MRSSSSWAEYNFSASFTYRLSKATGWPSCIKTSPRVKYEKTMCTQIDCLPRALQTPNQWTCSFSFVQRPSEIRSPNSKLSPSWASPSGTTILEWNSSRKTLIVVGKPRNDQSYVTLLGAFHSSLACTFKGSYKFHGVQWCIPRNWYAIAQMNTF